MQRLFGSTVAARTPQPHPRVRVLATVAAPSPNNTVQSPRDNADTPFMASPRSRFRSLSPLPGANATAAALAAQAHHMPRPASYHQ